MEIIKLREEFIKLGQALKAAGLVESGVEAKEVIQEGLVMVNGEVDTRRGRKLYAGDQVVFDGGMKPRAAWVDTCTMPSVLPSYFSVKVTSVAKANLAR